MISINFWAVLVCAVAAMILGFVWYGPVFGKIWMRVSGADAQDEERRKEMQRKSVPLYFVQFALALFQAYVLAWYIGTLGALSTSLHTAFSLWAAFIMPTVAASAMWNADSAKVKWTKFVLQAGYQLMVFIVFSIILSSWL